MIALLSVVAGVGYGAVSYYNDTQQRIEMLRANNAKLETAVAAKDAAIEQLAADAEKQAELNRKLSSDLQKSTQYQDELRSKLQKHDLTLNSLKKPALVEKAINNGTQKLLESLESITAKPTAQ